MEIKSHAQIEGGITITLKEEEARALHAICIYGPSQFTEMFYKHLGKTYLEPHYPGMKSLFDTVKNEMPVHLQKFDDVRAVLNKTKMESSKRYTEPIKVEQVSSTPNDDMYYELSLVDPRTATRTIMNITREISTLVQSKKDKRKTYKVHDVTNALVRVSKVENGFVIKNIYQTTDNLREVEFDDAYFIDVVRTLLWFQLEQAFDRNNNIQESPKQ